VTREHEGADRDEAKVALHRVLMGFLRDTPLGGRDLSEAVLTLWRKAAVAKPHEVEDPDQIVLIPGFDDENKEPVVELRWGPMSQYLHFRDVMSFGLKMILMAEASVTYAAVHTRMGVEAAGKITAVLADYKRDLMQRDGFEYDDPTEDGVPADGPGAGGQTGESPEDKRSSDG
jgi:hypothetical protein